jgi:hypothetical protein
MEPGRSRLQSGDQDSEPAFGLMPASGGADGYSACSARLAHRSAIESSMARISGLVVARIASRQWAAFCLQGVRIAPASAEEITNPLKFEPIYAPNAVASVAILYAS